MMKGAPNRWDELLGTRYRLSRTIGEGAAARVFEARDLKHDRDVAIKILRPEVMQEIISPRFQREVRIVAHLSHPHILPLFDSGEIDGVPYFVMPLVRGETLRAKIDREGALRVDVALSIARQVGAALEHAHGCGVVHRDIKPENVLFEGREALVTDFGIAREFTAQAISERLTAAGVVVGTPRYMSPEQAAGDPAIDARADVYALGCITFEMLTGCPPYTGTDLRALQVSRALDAPPSPRARRREVPVAADRAVRAAMAKDPGARLASARAFIDALATPLPLTAVPGGLAERRRRRWWWVAAVAIGSALLVIML